MAVVWEQGTNRFIDIEDDVCGAFAETFAAARALSTVAAGVVAVVNVLLKLMLSRKCSVVGCVRVCMHDPVSHLSGAWGCPGLVHFERHTSRSKEHAALSIKVFMAMFINTGLVVVAVQARLPQGKTFIPGTGILEVRLGCRGLEAACVCVCLTVWCLALLTTGRV